MSEWIKCSERMPEDGVVVWVTVKGYDFLYQMDGETLEEAIERTNTTRWVKEAFWNAKKKEWCDADCFPLIVKPIAWMPYEVPNPWGGEE